MICLCGFGFTFMMFPPTPGGGRPCRTHPLSGPAARKPRKVLKSCILAEGRLPWSLFVAGRQAARLQEGSRALHHGSCASEPLLRESIRTGRALLPRASSLSHPFSGVFSRRDPLPAVPPAQYWGFQTACVAPVRVLGFFPATHFPPSFPVFLGALAPWHLGGLSSSLRSSSLRSSSLRSSSLRSSPLRRPPQRSSPTSGSSRSASNSGCASKRSQSSQPSARSSRSWARLASWSPSAASRAANQ